MRNLLIAATGGSLAAGAVVVAGCLPTMSAGELALAAAIFGCTATGVIYAFLRA